MVSDKPFIRAHWKERRPDLAAASAQWSRFISEDIARSAEFQRAEKVGLYVARPWEVDLRSLWELAPAKCFFPRTDSKTLQMEFFSLDKWGELEQRIAGIGEPPARPTHQVWSWGAKDLILVPGACFDRWGSRIGSGLGFYDRFLSQQKCLRWGVCLSSQIWETALAQDPTDVRMGALFTEQGFLRIGS